MNKCTRLGSPTEAQIKVKDCEQEGVMIWKCERSGLCLPFVSTGSSLFRIATRADIKCCDSCSDRELTNASDHDATD